MAGQPEHGASGPRTARPLSFVVARVVRTFRGRVRTVSSLRDSDYFSHFTQDSASLRPGLTATPTPSGFCFRGSYSTAEDETWFSHTLFRPA